MLSQDLPEIHPIKLVTAENQGVIEFLTAEVDQIFANGVSGALVPGVTGGGLLGRHDFDEALAEGVELERAVHMPMQ